MGKKVQTAAQPPAAVLAGADSGAAAGLSSKAAATEGPRVATMDVDSYLASDEQAWLKYLSQPLRTYRKPGVTLKEEYQQWQTARARSRPAASAAQTQAQAQAAKVG